MIATSGFLTALQCTKSIFAGAPPGFRWGSLQRSPDSLAECKGSYF